MSQEQLEEYYWCYNSPTCYIVDFIDEVMFMDFLNQIGYWGSDERSGSLIRTLH